MKRISYIIMGIVALAVAACSVDDKVADYSSTITLTSSGDIEWTRGDKIAFSIYNSTGVVLDNIPFYNSLESGTYCEFYPTTTENTLYWGDYTSSDKYAAYSPYSSEVEDSKLSIDLSDQSAYQSLDILVSRGDLVDIEAGMDFEHLLALLSIEIELGDEYVAQDMQLMEVSVTSEIATSARYNLITGLLANDTAFTTVSNIYLNESTSTIECLLLPQSSMDQITISFSNTYVGDRTVTVSIPDGVIEQGKEYSATASISQDGISLSETTITPWVEKSESLVAATLYEPQLYDYILMDCTFLANEEGEEYANSSANQINPIVGLVYYISEDEGESYAMSISEYYGKFTLSSGLLPVTEDLDDGRTNMDAYIAQDSSLDAYMPVQWCYNLNSDYKKSIIESEGYADQTYVWYLPAQNELNDELFFALIPEFNAETTGLYRAATGDEEEMLMSEANVVNTDCEIENKINLYLYQVGGDIFGTGIPTLDADGMTEGYYNLVEYSLRKLSDNASYLDYVRYWCSNVKGDTNPYLVFFSRISNSGGTGYASGTTNATGNGTELRVRAVLKF